MRKMVLALLVAWMSSDPALAQLEDSFDQYDARRWSELPGGSEVADGTLRLAPAIYPGAVAITSAAKFGGGTILETRLRVIDAADSLVYIGFFTREPWARDSAWLMGEKGDFRLQVRGDFGDVVEQSVGRTLSDGQWHTLRIVRGADQVEVFVDDQLQAAVPIQLAAEMPVAFDINAQSDRESRIEIDHISVKPVGPSTQPAKPQERSGIEDDFNAYDRQVWIDTNLPGATVARDGYLHVPPHIHNGGNLVASIDKFRLANLELRFRIHGLNSPKNFFYFGFIDTGKWGRDLAWTMVENGQIRLQVRRGGGAVNESVVGPKLQDDQWHTLKINWTAQSVELFVDDRSYGKVTDTATIPTAAIAAVMHLMSTEKELPWVDVDWVKVNGEVLRGLPPVDVAPTPPVVKKVVEPVDGPPLVRLDAAQKHAAISNPHYRVELDWSNGLRARRIAHAAVGDMLGAPSPLFRAAVREKLLPVDDFTVVSSAAAQDGQSQVLSVTLRSKTHSDLSAVMEFRADGTKEMRWSLAFKNEGAEPLAVGATFPLMENVTIGEKSQDNHFFFPYHAGWAGNVPADLRTEYGTIAWMQLLSAYNPSAGGGVYFYPLDETGELKTLSLRKTEPGVQSFVNHELFPAYNDPGEIFSADVGKVPAIAMGIRHVEMTVKPGQTWAPPDARVGISTGDWKAGFFNYRDWLRSWWKHRDDMPQWWKEQFNNCSAHDNDSGFWSEEQQRYVMAENLRGHEDVSEWALWWSYPTENRQGQWGTGIWRKFNFGDYEYPEHRGGLSALRDAIGQAQGKGVFVRLYMEVTMLWKGTATGAAHGRQWARMDRPGVYNMDFASGSDDGYSACGQEPGWQERVAEMGAGWVRDLGVKSVRLDRGNIMFPCFNSEHVHYDGTARSAARPDQFAQLFRKTLDQMRKVDPEAVVLGEHAGSDYLAQFSDGSTDQSFQFPGPRAALRPLSMHQICFFRFLAPQHRLYTWGYGGAAGERYAFFNGIGMESRSDSLTGRVQRETAAALASPDPQPMVETRMSQLHANYFPSERLSVYMLYNRGSAAATGPLLPIEIDPGWHAVELCEDEVPVLEGASPGGTELNHSIPAGEVRCIALMPRTLSVAPGAGGVKIVAAALDADSRVEIHHNSDAGAPLQTIEIPKAGREFDCQWSEPGKYIVKRMIGRMLVDQQVMSWGT